MIFLTVGAQMPFDRLVRLVDDWAEASGRNDVFGQIGPTSYRPRRIEVEAFLSPALFRERMRAASAVVAHAGMGTILTALELRRPLLVFPRLARLGETRNDHQVATARHFGQEGKVLSVLRDEDLPGALDRLAAFRPDAEPPRAAPALLERIRGFALG